MWYRSPVGRIFDTIQRYFEADDWQMDTIPGQPTLACRFQNEHGREWGCLALAIEEAEQFVFYSVVLGAAPQERHREVIDFIMRANYGMQVGNFEMDVHDGEVRFKTSIDVEDTELSRELWRNVVQINLLMMGIYFDGLTAVIDGRKSATEAVGEIEHDTSHGFDDDDDDGDDDPEQGAAH